MKAIYIFCLLLLNFTQVHAFDINSFMNRPLVVQQIENEIVKNSFIGFFKDGSVQNIFSSQYGNQMTQNFAAACISRLTTNCKYESDYQAIFLNQFKINFARKSKAATYLEKIPLAKALVESTYNPIDPEKFGIAVSINGNKQGFLVSKQNVLSNVSIDFAEFQEAKSNRKSLTEVTLKDKDLSTSVVQIIKNFDLNNSLYGGSGSSGTGFFISEDGYLLTNHHVISAQTECIINLQCMINLKQTLPDGSEKNVQLNANLVAMSIFHDFALMKVNLQQKLAVRPLKLNFSNVQANIMTLGYPGDKIVNDKYLLTYSYGQPIGFNSNGLKTTSFIFGGASGSPLLNQDSQEVIGIMSNGQDEPADGSGSPGTARLLSYIESEYGISEYLSGQKQFRIKVILDSIRKSADEGSVVASLNLLSKEKSFYGLPLLKQIMINSETKIVRKKIMEYLQRQSILSGPSSH